MPNTSSITANDVRSLLPFFEELKQLADIAETVLGAFARNLDQPPPKDEDIEMVDDKLSGRINRIATDTEGALPKLAHVHSTLAHGKTSPTDAATTLLRAAQTLLEGNGLYNALVES